MVSYSDIKTQMQSSIGASCPYIMRLRQIDSSRNASKGFPQIGIAVYEASNTPDALDNIGKERAHEFEVKLWYDNETNALAMLEKVKTAINSKSLVGGWWEVIVENYDQIETDIFIYTVACRETKYVFS